MRYYQFLILNNLKQDLKLYQPDITTENLEAVLHSYTNKLYWNSDLKYRIDKTNDPETFNFRVKKIIPEWKSTWDTSLIQIVWGVIDGTFTVFVYEPKQRTLDN